MLFRTWICLPNSIKFTFYFGKFSVNFLILFINNLNDKKDENILKKTYEWKAHGWINFILQSFIGHNKLGRWTFESINSQSDFWRIPASQSCELNEIIFLLISLNFACTSRVHSPFRSGFLNNKCFFHFGLIVNGNCGDGLAVTECVINKSEKIADKTRITIFIGSTCYSRVKLIDNQRIFWQLALL